MKTLGQVAFAAYCAARTPPMNWTWEQAHLDVRHAFEAAAQAVVEEAERRRLATSVQSEEWTVEEILRNEG